jgi:hypothetical protein
MLPSTGKSSADSGKKSLPGFLVQGGFSIEIYETILAGY